MMTPAPRASIEYAHALLGLDADTEAAATEHRIGAEIARLLKNGLEEMGVAAQTVVLLDDKQLSPARNRSIEASRVLASLDLKPDLFVFESDLRDLGPALLEVVRGPRQNRLAHEMERRAIRGSHLACSVDIAIWHLLRLGVLRPPPTVPKWQEQLLAESVPHDRAYSILPNRLRAVEDKARRENINAVSPEISKRIELLYFDPDGGTEQATNSVQKSLDRLRGTLNVNNSHH